MSRNKTNGPPIDSDQDRRIAIDIGFYSIKCAYFKDRLLCLEEFPIFDEPKDLKGLREQILLSGQGAAIKKAVSMIDPKAEFILSSPPSRQVLTRVLYHPPDTDVRRFLEKELALDTDQFGFDTQKIEEAPKDKRARKGEKRPSKVAVAVTDLDFIQRSISLLGEYQLQVKRLTPSAVALLNYLRMTGDEEERGPVVLLDLGAFFSHLIIYKDRGTFLARTLEVGGTQFNQELVGRLNVDHETAERIKRERKLIDDDLFEPKASSGSMTMFQAVNPVLFGLTEEIKNSMTWFEDSFVEDISDAVILLAGGASKLQNLDRFLTKELQLPAATVENAVHPLSPGHQFLPQFASTVGLLGDPSRGDLLDLNLISNTEGLLFKLEDGDYYLTKDGFVSKKKYKKRHKGLRPSVVSKPRTDSEEPAFSPFAYLKGAWEKVMSLLPKGEKGEMREVRVSFSQEGLRPTPRLLKLLFVALGALFIVIYGLAHFAFAPQKKAVDRAATIYVNKRTELDRLRGSPETGKEKGEAPVPAGVVRTDKIIWAGKLKAIAEAIPQSVWISHLAIHGTPPGLVLSCHVTSYGEDQLRDIALFIENLKTQEGFLKDFVEVKFHSAVRNTQDKDVYDFSLTLPLRREMIQEITETAGKASG